MRKVHFWLYNHALWGQWGRAVTMGIDWSLELQWIIVMSLHDTDMHRRSRGLWHRPLPLGRVTLSSTTLHTHFFHPVKLRWRSCSHMDVVRHTSKFPWLQE